MTSDAVDEDDETVVIRLSSPANATFGAAGAEVATGTILDDDTALVSVVGGVVPEGAAGTETVANAIVSLSTTSARAVSVR